jgi:hypothetical protein
MTTIIPNIETYPKHFMLRDGTAVTLRPLVEEDQARLLEFFRRVSEGERYYLKEKVASPEVIQVGPPTWPTAGSSQSLL